VPHESLLTTARTIALRAGELARLRRSEGVAVAASKSSPVDIVTEVDRETEALIRGLLADERPGDGFFGEESGAERGSTGLTWIVDPIDGTVNYAHGLPQYAISVAYAQKGALKLGVISNPPMAEFFSAEAGKGAWLNGTPIRVSDTRELIDSMLITGFRHHLIDTPRSNIINFVRLSREAQVIRRLGAAALDIAYVACGRAEGFWEIALNPWDVAAGILMVREAGGVVSTLYGEGHLLRGEVDILAANQEIYPKMQAILAEERNKTL